MTGFSLYIHIPYCYHKCPYCDFNTYAVSQVPEKEYVSALLSEIDYRSFLPEWRGRQVNTIYFGGGTPSIFSSLSIKQIISSIARLFPIADNIEISLEANPGPLTSESLFGYKEAGVGRLSFGSQSLNLETLKTLGRIHTPQQVEQSFMAAKEAGFKNINLDIIYGVPGQRPHDLAADLAAMIALEPQHISPYGLTIEKGTPFYTSYKKGTLKLPPEDNVVEMMQIISTELSAHNFKRYEISNFALPGKEARHNIAYWECSDYLGIGAGAHSFIKTNNSAKRWSNFAAPGQYIKSSTSKGNAESWQDSLSTADLIFEYFFLGLRKIKGVDLKIFEERFKIKAEAIYGLTFEVLGEQGLLETEDNQVRLNERGLMLFDSVIENFVIDAPLPESLSEIEFKTENG